jgi:copper transporter 1
MAWTPRNVGEYAGTCIFLIIFATIFRALLAVRVNVFEVLAVVNSRHGKDYAYAAECKSTIRPWRVNEAVMLASMDVILAGIGYLLSVPLDL